VGDHGASPFLFVENQLHRQKVAEIINLNLKMVYHAYVLDILAVDVKCVQFCWIG